MTFGLTSDQQLAADPDTSAWVEASAGTGKTHVLTARVLALLLTGGAPERILALTFTKAAAAEMANRVLSRLGQWAVMQDDALTLEIKALTTYTPKPELLGHARGLFAKVLNLPRGLNIQTIHAFCQSLLGRFPVESGLPPQFQVMDERTQDEILSSTRDKIMGECKAAPSEPLSTALGEIVTLAGESQFNALMNALLRERVVLNRLSSVKHHLGALLKQALDLPINETAQDVLNAACASENIDENGLARAAKALCQGSAKEVERGTVLSQWLLEDMDARTAQFDACCMVFLTGTGEVRKSLANKPTLNADPDLEPILYTEALRLQAAQQRMALHRFVDRSMSLLRAGLELAREFDAAKQRLGLADYDDLIAKTADLLTEQTMAGWVLYKLDGGIDHILIDEAQDTNPEQWRVIKALSEEFFSGEGARDLHRTIFAVGDVKQSIYGFQRAAPELFLQNRDHFRHMINAVEQRFEAVPLDLSFRSTDAVLALVDAVFRGEAARGLSSSEREIRHLAHRSGHAGRVELWPTVKSDTPARSQNWELPVEVQISDTPQAALANNIADRIALWIGREHLPARGRPMRAGDIMILVRRRTAFVENLVRALKVRHIPIAGVDRFDLLSPIAVQDLLALLQFAVLPDDDLTLAAILKGPFIGLSEDALFQLAHDRKSSLWQVFRTQDDFPAGRGFLQSLLARADYTPPYEFLESILNEHGGRKHLLARLGAEAEEAIDELLSQALAFEASHTPSLDGFLHWIHARASEVKRDPEQASDAVRIMTVHGAKGLQAPVVILPDTCQIAKDDAPLLMIDGQEGTPLPLWYKRKEDQIGPIADAKSKREADAAAEAKRLLYVALTRAEDRLIITGWETRKGRAKGCWYDMVADGFARLEHVVPDGLQLIFETGQNKEPKPDLVIKDTKLTRPLPDWATRPAPLEGTPPRPLAPSRMEDGPATISPLQSEAVNAFARGRIIHKLLQRLPDLNAQDRMAAARRYLAAAAGEWSEDIRIETAKMVLALIDDPRLSALFAPGTLSEVPLSGIVGTHVVSGQIDRLLITPARIVFADYKTNRTPPKDSLQIPRAYLRQMAAYHAVLKAIYQDRPVTGVLIWTSNASARILTEAQLAETAI